MASPGPGREWLIACRASVLFMTFTAAALGGLMAWRAGVFQWDLWLATVLGLMFAHATNNLLNDYTDSRRGIDKDNYYRNQYGVHVLEDKLLSLPQFWSYVAVTGGAAIALGAWLVWERSGLTLQLMLAGAFFVLFYTWPLKYFGLGEPAVLLVWGPLMVGGTYYVLTGNWSWDVTWLSLLYALGPTSVLFGKHIDKLDADSGKKIRTPPVILGEKMSRYSVVGMLIAQFFVIAYLVYSGFFHPIMLIVLGAAFSLKRVFRVFSHPRPKSPPPELPKGVWPLYFVATAFWYSRRFGLLFLVGLLLDSVLT